MVRRRRGPKPVREALRRCEVKLERHATYMGWMEVVVGPAACRRYALMENGFPSPVGG